MRVLVVGASGYVGSRVIPAFLAHGHTVRAGARDPDSLRRFWWHDHVEVAALDVTDEATLPAALADVDTVVYLVHGMRSTDFRAVDLTAARSVRRALDASAVTRAVYVSGLIPQVDTAELSEHLLSRWEVERELSRSRVPVITIRAAIVLGSGSTSFEVLGQLGGRLPVTVVPDRMNSRVEPIAVVDLVAAVLGAARSDLPTTSFDVAGGEIISYPDLLKRYGDITGMPRAQIRVPFLPDAVLGRVGAWIADAPSETVAALMESLRHDMIARDHRWIGTLVPPDHRPLGIDQALCRAVLRPDPGTPPGRLDPMGALPGDPAWAVAAKEARRYSARGIPPRRRPG